MALEAFEDARTKLAKAPTSALCDAALKALKTMKDKAKESGDALEAKGFKDVAKEVYASLLNTVHTAATATVTAKNSFELIKLKKAAKLLADDAADKQTASTDTFAPGTTIRDSLDLKAAKIHSDESLVAIKPLSDKIFTENKALLGLDKQIKQVAADVAALKIT